ncbi:hypothetical protein [Aquabacterium sp.]|uniref:hypothetical protein n=1 Tax=Aquabacterium sp. TaxID=1872578 RepID=UPI0026384F87|nr:hypothetical protein [Aquabacterium sp.]MDD2977889.1 hypothetical protein [Aquabacterium sp.]
MSRRLMSLTEVRTIVDDVDAGMEALCELLHKANSEVVCAQSVLTLLQPLRRQLSEASSDLNDMRL